MYSRKYNSVTLRLFKMYYVAHDHLYLTSAFEAFYFDCYDFLRSLNAQKESQDVFFSSWDPLPILVPYRVELSSLGICSVLMLRFDILHSDMQCCAMLCCAMLCSAAVLHCTAICYAVLDGAALWTLTCTVLRLSALWSAAPRFAVHCWIALSSTDFFFRIFYFYNYITFISLHYMILVTSKLHTTLLKK